MSDEHPQIHLISFRVRTLKKAKRGNAMVSGVTVTYVTATSVIFREKLPVKV